MNIAGGIDIEDGQKIKCSKCKNTLAVINPAGEMLFRQITIAYISKQKNSCELKCRECGTINEINNFS